jgi:hypothetical protein
MSSRRAPVRSSRTYWPAEKLHERRPAYGEAYQATEADATSSSITWSLKIRGGSRPTTYALAFVETDPPPSDDDVVNTGAYVAGDGQLELVTPSLVFGTRYRLKTVTVTVQGDRRSFVTPLEQSATTAPGIPQKIHLGTPADGRFLTTTGAGNSALDFVGSSFTVLYWLYRTSYDSFTPMHKSATFVSNGWYIQQRNINDLTLRIYVGGSRAEKVSWITGGINVWRHYACVFDRDDWIANSTMYENGINLNPGGGSGNTIAQSDNSNSEEVHVGDNMGSAWGGGYMMNIALVNKSLSAQEVADIHAGGRGLDLRTLPTVSPHIQTYWPMFGSLADMTGTFPLSASTGAVPEDDWSSAA